MPFATYYVTLESGATITIKNVTATPTLVNNLTIKDAYYRDEGPTFQGIGTYLAETVITPGSPDTAAAVIVSPSPDINLSLSDTQMHVEPRQLSFLLSYWEFLVAPVQLLPAETFGYYIRWDRLTAMSTEPPSFF